MGKDDWYRRTTWSPEDRDAFAARLRRSRSDGAKAQYLRIQASYLLDTGKHSYVQAALELLEVLFSEYLRRTEMAQAHLQAAKCHEFLGDVHSAIRHFRLAVQAEKDVPNVTTQVTSDFPWFIATNRLQSLYREALEVLECAQTDLVLPREAFKRAATRALIARDREEYDEAAAHAAEALAAADREHSGLRYHQSLGLVGKEHEPVVEEMRRIAACQ